MLSTKEILKFLKNIYFAKDRKFDDSFLPMWVREITTLGASVADLHNAEIEIIRENVPLVVSEVCDVIRENIKRPMLEYKKIDCPYCKGRGHLEGLKFEKNGKYTGYTALVNCCCGNKPMADVMVMKEDNSNNHRTETKDGYFLVFPSVVEKFAYLDKVYANGNYDLRR